uniref:M-zodatoxin-Lt1a n=1 Tax=Lachesana tarabaevi TaxID=379576 RepID=LAT1_LACTA|nr:RecName: Full=M-zodatoxin-Lt1a; Short=M-ZDTX-Lt1a; AltName: Full=Latarcin-1; Short=Ltc-1; Short=Ltc1; Flags: Precursor [Lachesana tarabaevi]CAJ81660.1 latarcin 1 precursor, pLtc 1 [Lachesana tarabaevi]
MKYFVVALALAVALVCIAESTAYDVNEELENELDDLSDAAWLAKAAEDLQALDDFEESEESRSMWSGMWRRKLKKLRNALKKKLKGEK